MDGASSEVRPGSVDQTGFSPPDCDRPELPQERRWNYRRSACIHPHMWKEDSVSHETR